MLVDLIAHLIAYLVIGLIFAEFTLFCSRMARDNRYNAATYRIAVLTWPLAILYIIWNWRRDRGHHQ